MKTGNLNLFASNMKRANEVFAEYGDFIRAVICSKIRDKAQVDDVYQNFFLSIVSKPIPMEAKNVKSYIYRALIHDIIDVVRKTERYKNRIHKYANHISRSVNTQRPEDAFIEVEQTKKFFALITEKLPSSEAQAVTLRYKNNYNDIEIANKMNIKKNSAIRYICIGLKKLKKIPQLLRDEREN